MKNTKNQLEKSRKEFEKFRCIQSGCNSNGIIAVGDENGEPMAEQCQFCFEFLLPVKSFLTQSSHDLILAIVRDLESKRDYYKISYKNPNDTILDIQSSLTALVENQNAKE